MSFAGDTITGGSVSGGGTPSAEIEPTPLALTGNPHSIPDVERLFLFDGNLNEETAGSDLFTAVAGSALYRDSVFPGAQCLYLNGSSSFDYSVANSTPFHQLAEMSMIAVVSPFTTNDGYIMTTGRFGSDPGEYNNCWGLKTKDDTPSKIVAFHESGEGVNQEAVSERGAQIGQWTTIGWSRPTAATTYTFYEAGLAAGEDTVAAAPSEGQDSKLSLGGFSAGSGQFWTGYVALVAFWWDELTAEQFRTIDRYLMGR
ncbi:MAG: hypothetical protein ACO3O3_13920 [Ilumatobacteraceae bacterium]